MARVNVGVNPLYLSDQHLIAESVEITMITGGLRKNGYRVMSPIPYKLNLGTGHINFFKNKIEYLCRRLMEVNKELTRRGIKNSTIVDLQEFAINCNYDLLDNWRPTLEDSMVLRERIYDRLINPRKAKAGFHRYEKQVIPDLKEFAEKLINSPLYFV